MKNLILNKIKEVFNGPNKWLARFILASSLIFIFVWIVGPGHTFGHLFKAKIQDKRQQKEIVRLQEENAELDRQIEMMSNQDSLEKYAREQYYFAEPGEDVYVIE